MSLAYLRTTHALDVIHHRNFDKNIVAGLKGTPYSAGLSSAKVARIDANHSNRRPHGKRWDPQIIRPAQQKFSSQHLSYNGSR